jgi:predicted transcriptional regulator
MTVRPMIWEYLTDRPGEEIHLNTMVMDLDLTRSQIQQGMRYLVDKGFVDQVIQGNSWRYLPKQTWTEGIDFHRVDGKFVEGPAPVLSEGALTVVKAVAAGDIEKGQAVQYVKTVGDLFEVIKNLNDGRLLLQDSEGVLYVAKKLET